MGSDWEEFCESRGMNPHDPDDYEDFLDDLSRESNSERPATQFLTFQEAADWARRNPGRAFSKSPNGMGFMPKTPSMERQTNRFEGKEGWIIARMFKDAVSGLSPHIVKRYTTSAPFLGNEMLADLRNLTAKEVAELETVLIEYCNYCKNYLSRLERYCRERRLNPEDYGYSDQEQWITDLEFAISLCFGSS